jgi:hypothetical protein
MILAIAGLAMAIIAGIVARRVGVEVLDRDNVPMMRIIPLIVALAVIACAAMALVALYEVGHH